MNHEVIFIEASEADADALLVLIHQLEHFITKETLLNNLKNSLSNKYYRLFVAKENNKVLGFAELHFMHFIHEKHERARLTSFCVDEQYRNQQVGTKFLFFLEAFCKNNQLQRIELTSHVRRLDAHRFYEKNGYTFTSKRFYKEL